MIELAPLLFEMIKPALKERFPNLHAGWQDSGVKGLTVIVIWKNSTPALAVRVYDDFVMVERQVPRYETEPKKILAAYPDMVDRILDVLVT